jgi:hypothetical protein
MRHALGSTLLAFGLAACSTPATTTAAADPTAQTRTTEALVGDARPISQIHASKCGSCHVPVQPGTRSRDQIEAAMSRHGKRLRLTQAQWTAMVEYLAPAVGSVQAKTDGDQNVR